MMKKVLLFTIVCLAALVFFAGEALGDDVCVDNATALQDALDDAVASGESDIIKVVQGTYNGNFTFSSGEGLSITLLGGYTTGCASRTVDPANTILDGGESDGVLSLSSHGGNITVDGFTIQNGTDSTSGGGLSAQTYVTDPSGDITISNNIVTANNAEMDGGGISAYSYSSGDAGDIILVNNIIVGNTAGSSNDGGGVDAASFSTSGGNAGTITLTNNTIAGNTTGNRGGGVCLNASTNGTVNCYNNIVWGNTATAEGGDVYLTKGSGAIASAYNNDAVDGQVAGETWDYEGGNISADPLLTGDYHLKSRSPCIDAGNSCAPGILDYDFEGDDRIIDGNNDGEAYADIGADEFVPGSIISNIFMLLFQ